MPQIAMRGAEDTEPVIQRPMPWYQRFPTAVAAAGLGVFLLAVIGFAVVTVSNDSTHPPGTVRGTPTSLTPVPSVSTSSAAAPTAGQTPPDAPIAGQTPPDAPIAGQAPRDAPIAGQTLPDAPTAAPTPPTVTETASTENVTTDAPAIGPAPDPGFPGRQPWWRRLFPHHFGGQ